MPTGLQLSTIVWKGRDYSTGLNSRSEAYGMTIECAAIIATWDGNGMACNQQIVLVRNAKGPSLGEERKQKQHPTARHYTMS